MTTIQSFITNINEFTWMSDVFDILIVTLLFYGLIKITKGTKVMQLLKGIVLFFLLYVIANLFDMVTCIYLFEMLFENFLLILGIIFAPEIRNTLENIGRKKILKEGIEAIFGHKNTLKQEQTMSAISEICSACQDMASNKTGALIVFERDGNLNEISNTGINVKSQISSELVKTIFFHNSPLHDGAMIIKNNKIHSAGCILPLTDQSINSKFGTRHRAAIGITEQSDAVSVVVSEETGHISICKSGQLINDISIYNLKEELVKSLLKENIEPVKNKIIKNKRRANIEKH